MSATKNAPISTGAKLNINEVTQYLTRIIIDNTDLEKDGIRATAISLVGPAGIAKTSAVKALKELRLGPEPNDRIEVVKISMSNIEESGD